MQHYKYLNQSWVKSRSYCNRVVIPFWHSFEQINLTKFLHYKITHRFLMSQIGTIPVHAKHLKDDLFVGPVCMLLIGICACPIHKLSMDYWINITKIKLFKCTKINFTSTYNFMWSTCKVPMRPPEHTSANVKSFTNIQQFEKNIKYCIVLKIIWSYYSNFKLFFMRYDLTANFLLQYSICRSFS
jgi:hypothetical protein